MASKQSKIQRNFIFQIISLVIVFSVLGFSIYWVNHNNQNTSLSTVGQVVGKLPNSSGTACINSATCTIKASAGSSALRATTIDSAAFAAETSCTQTMNSDPGCTQPVQKYSNSCNSQQSCNNSTTSTISVTGKCTIATGSSDSSIYSDSFHCQDYSVKGNGSGKFTSTVSGLTYICDGISQTLNGKTTYFTGTTCKFNCSNNTVSQCLKAN